MKVEIPEGKYILAVSGGVDSMVLLHLLMQKNHQSTGRKNPNPKEVERNIDYGLSTTDSTSLQLVVAHFNHNIRKDSGEDEKLVRLAAIKYGLPYETGSAHLGNGASEATARDARYAFLGKIQQKHKAKAIITAHHQDDLIETAMINVIRGSGRLGLSSIANNDKVIRPMLDIPKADILAYAKKYKLEWREDSTNANQDYLRNYLRASVIPKLTARQRKNLISKLEIVAKTNIEIDNKIATLSLKIGDDKIDRDLFSSLPANLGNELIAYHLRRADITDFDLKTVNRLSMAVKTSKPNSSHPIRNTSTLLVSPKTAKITTP